VTPSRAKRSLSLRLLVRGRVARRGSERLPPRAMSITLFHVKRHDRCEWAVLAWRRGGALTSGGPRCLLFHGVCRSCCRTWQVDSHHRAGGAYVPRRMRQRCGWRRECLKDRPQQARKGTSERHSPCRSGSSALWCRIAQAPRGLGSCRLRPSRLPDRQSAQGCQPTSTEWRSTARGSPRPHLGHSPTL
jgi:hypothetical protein